MTKPKVSRVLIAIAVATACLSMPVDAREKITIDPHTACCDLSQARGVVWTGSGPVMTFDRLAAYCGPILWFSPDEPLLERQRGKAIRLTEAFPFEEQADAPVVYYRINEVYTRGNMTGPAFTLDSTQKGSSIIDLSQVNGVDIRYCLYYPSEEGLGGHRHDLEVVDIKLFVWKWSDYIMTECDDCAFGISVVKVIGRAHGLQWYDNHLETDIYTEFPIGILVEEGKHANCPDKNLDGMYTPGYDVNLRVNDAWGVRDIIRGGALFTGGFQSWMNKIRREEDRVFPPLPEDSPLREDFTEGGEYAPHNAIYELRPLPRKELALPDVKLEHYIESKGDPDWPYEIDATDLRKVGKWLDAEGALKSLSIAFRADGDDGVSFAFPFFVVKNLQDPMGGGWIVHRMYLKDRNLRDFGWTLLYTLSASRWIDGYLSGGVEWDREDVLDSLGAMMTETRSRFVMESGIKLRVNMRYSPFKFLTKLTDFWGLRVGLMYRGNVTDFDRIGLIFEIGAGAF